MECETSRNIFGSEKFLTTDQELINLVDDDCASTTMKKRSKIRFMYIAAFASLILAIPMGLAVGYSAPATYDMEFRANSMVKPTKSEITWIGSMLAVGATIGGIFAGKYTFFFHVFILHIGCYCYCFYYSPRGSCSL